MKSFLSKNSIYIAFAITIMLALVLLIFGFCAENMNLKIFNNMPLSQFMGRCFECHYALKHKDYITDFVIETCYKTGYIVYYAILYIFIIFYAIIAITVCARCNTISWCGYVITLSVIFLIFMNAYTTEMLQYPDETNTAIYNMNMTSFISLTSILSGIAGIKIAFLFEKSSNKKKRIIKSSTTVKKDNKNNKTKIKKKVSQ